MKNLNTFEELNESGMDYDKNKLYSYEYIKQLMKSKKPPRNIQEELTKLKPVMGKNSSGHNVMFTKIPERLYNYLFGKRW